MPGHGKLEPFDATSEVLTDYLERFEFYCVANEVRSESKKRAIFLTSIGQATFEKAKALISPRSLETTSFSDIKSALESHFSPAKIEIAERYRFFQRRQSNSECVAEYVAALRKLAVHCNFGTYLDTALRDQLVCGLYDIKCQKELLCMSSLLLQDAVQHAKAYEAVARESAAIHPTQPTAEVDSGTQQVEFVSSGSRGRACFRCGSQNHLASRCRFGNAVCFACGGRGHLAAVCRSPAAGVAAAGGRRPAGRGGPAVRGGRAAAGRPGREASGDRRRRAEDDGGRTAGRSDGRHVNQMGEPEDDSDEEYSVLHAHQPRCGKLLTTLTVNDKPLQMEVDTGAEITTIPEHVFRKLFEHDSLYPSSKKLSQYDGTPLQVCGEMLARVEHNGQTFNGAALIVNVRNKYPLLGRDWLFRVKLDWNRMFQGMDLHAVSVTASQLQEKYKEVFSEQLGEIRGIEADIELDDNAKPRFFRSRPVPFPLREKVNQELEKQLDEGELYPVQNSEWAAPLVIVKKPGGNVRICADFKVTVNRYVKQQSYPLPTTEEIFSSLSKGESYTKLDLANAYKQLRVSEKSQELLTVNTPRGLMRYKRLPFGLNISPNIWQRTMDHILQGLKGVVCYLDDILLTGASRQEHIANLERLLDRLQQYGVRLRKEKCLFFQQTVDFLGYTLSTDGVRPSEKKVSDVLAMPAPQNAKQLLTFLGMVTYNAKFLPQLSTVLRPLYDLTKGDALWNWSQQCQRTFDKVKSMLANAVCLAHYDLDKELKVYCDASSVGLGACMVHVDESGERPIAFASRTLTEAEKKYAQVEREALAIVFAVKRWHQYLCGRIFTLATDHKPLCHVFGPHTQIPSVAAARLQRWALILSMYRYRIEHLRGTENVTADALSRLPGPDTSDPAVHMLGDVEEGCSAVDDVLPVTASQVAAATARDPVLSVVLGWARTGAWPGHVGSSQLKPYLQRRDQLTVIDGCLQLGEKVVIPDRYRARLLRELHEGHVGMSKMKSLARVFLWWPKLDDDIEEVCKTCQSCVENANMPKPETIHPWKYPVQPWDRVHIDFATFDDRKYLLLVDAYSKWPEVRHMSSTTAARTIEVLTDIFATHGFPVTLVSDNGPPFTSDEFQRYLAGRGIHHRLTPPYHPASNGQAESLVRTFKAFLKKYAGPRVTAVAQFLGKYRTTPCVTTGRAPAELLLGRLPRTKLSLLKPNVQARMQNEAVTKVSRSFFAGQPVMVRDLRPTAAEKWQRAVITSRGGPLTYSVRLPDGRVRLAHVDHLLADGSARAPADSAVTPGTQAAEPPRVEPGQLRGDVASRRLSEVGRFPEDADAYPGDADRVMCGSDGADDGSASREQARPTLRRSARLAEKR